MYTNASVRKSTNMPTAAACTSKQAMSRRGIMPMELSRKKAYFNCWQLRSNKKQRLYKKAERASALSVLKEPSLCSLYC